MTRTPLLVLLTCLWGTSLAQAQTGQPYYGNGWYPPTAPRQPNMPYGNYGYPPTYRQPIQAVQYSPGIYGNYPTGGYVAPAAYYYQRASYPPKYYGYNNGYGVNYYYPKNPLGYSPTPAPYSAVATKQALNQLAGGWPAPPGALLAEDVVPERSGPELPFHRPTNRFFWVSANYVGMFMKPMGFAGPLLTTGSTAFATPGVLGQTSTAVLFGNQATDFNLMSGFRAEAGIFLDQQNRFSLDVTGFWILTGKQSYNIAGDASGNPVLSRPVFNIDNGREGAFINSVPNTITGTFSADMRSELGGFEINARYHYYVKERLHADALFGFRYVRLAEQLQILENIKGIQAGFVTFRGQPIALNESLIDDDLFRTTNQFFGPQIGGQLSWEQKWFTTTGFAKLGLGATYQQTNIAGSTTLVSPLGNQVASGGILALPSTIGTHNRTVFGILPEFGFNVGIHLNPCVQLKLGYSLLLWNHVLRAGNQFDRALNPGQVPGSPTFGGIAMGPSGPIFRFNDEFFWSHAFNLGVEVHY